MEEGARSACEARAAECPMLGNGGRWGSRGAALPGDSSANSRVATGRSKLSAGISEGVRSGARGGGGGGRLSLRGTGEGVGRDACAGLGAGGLDVGREAAGIKVPTGRQRGMPSRQTNAPSPSLPERRAMISCSMVISTVSRPPKSTYHSGLSEPGGVDDGFECPGAEACGALLGVRGRGGGSAPDKLGSGARVRRPLLSAATADSESSK